jgi:two-component system, OmpR family, response regulator
MMRVLIAEDDHATADFIADGLKALGHQPVVAEGGGQALLRVAEGGFDMIILDRMLPHADGLDILRKARADGDATPIIMLTALGQIADRVDGLDAGADDYLVKPFALSELAARMNAIIRRRSADSNQTSLTYGALVMDLLHREVQFEGRPVLLQPRETRLLEELMRNAGKIVTRAMLFESVWGFHFNPRTNLVETHMSRLRTKLGYAGAKDIIETVRGAGYRLWIEDAR